MGELMAAVCHIQLQALLAQEGFPEGASPAASDNEGGDTPRARRPADVVQDLLQQAADARLVRISLSLSLSLTHTHSCHTHTPTHTHTSIHARTHACTNTVTIHTSSVMSSLKRKGKYEI